MSLEERFRRVLSEKESRRKLLKRAVGSAAAAAIVVVGGREVLESLPEREYELTDAYFKGKITVDLTQGLTMHEAPEVEENNKIEIASIKELNGVNIEGVKGFSIENTGLVVGKNPHEGEDQSIYELWLPVVIGEPAQTYLYGVVTPMGYLPFNSPFVHPEGQVYYKDELAIVIHGDTPGIVEKDSGIMLMDTPSMGVVTPIR